MSVITSADSTTVSRLAVLLFTDIAGSTELKSRLGAAAYSRLLSRHDGLFKQSLAGLPSVEVINDTGDGYLVAFATASDAVRFALRMQKAMHDELWGANPLRVSIGVHLGEITEVADASGRPRVIGLAIDLAGRLTALAMAGQILLTRTAFDEARQFLREYPTGAADAASPPPRGSKLASEIPLRWIAHGDYRFKGADEPVEVFEVGGEGIAPLAPPPNSDNAKRSVSAAQEETLGWRPAVGLEVPQRVGWMLEQRLGEGTFGEVWLARDEVTKRRSVFKFCFDLERLHSFKREVTFFRLLRDALGERRDIAQLYDVRLDEPPYFLESEYAPGGNLHAWADAQGGLVKVPLATRLEMVAKICDAVAAAHSIGILHKDIKPGNILVHVDADGTLRPQLADFGIGLLVDRTQLVARHITEIGFTGLDSEQSSRTGTRMYAPPESLTGRPFTTQGDIYALGVLLYQSSIADLERPVALGWERDVNDELLREDIAGCIEGDPARRFKSAAEVATRLRTLPQRRAQRIAEAQARKTSERRHRLLRGLAAAAVILVVLSALAVVGFVRERQLRVRAEASERNAQLAYAAGSLEQGNALHLAGRGQESRAAFMRARDEFSRLEAPTLAAEVGLDRSYREFDAPINTLIGHTDGLMAVAWMPDGRRACSAGEDGTIRLWDVRTGREIRRFTGHAGVVSSIAISPDGKMLLSGGADRSVRLWDVESGTEIRRMGEPAGEVRGVAFSPDGRSALSGSADRPGIVRMWDVQSGKLVRKFTTPTGEAFYGVAFSPDGRSVLATTYEKGIWIWDAASAQVVHHMTGHTNYVISAAFSADGRHVLSASFDQSVRMWNTQSGAEMFTWNGHTAGARAVAFVGDNVALSAGMDWTLRMWDLDHRSAIRTFAGHTDGVRGLAVSPDRGLAISAGVDKTARVWDLRPNAEVPSVQLGAKVTSLACSADGTYFLCGDVNGTVQVRDVATLRTLRSFAAHRKPIDCATVLADGHRLFTADADGNCKMWDLMSGRELRSYPGHGHSADPEYIRARGWTFTAITADGNIALTSQPDRTIALWSTESGSVLATLPASRDEVAGIAISPDSKHAMSGDKDGRIFYWDLDGRRALFSTPLAAKTGSLDCIAFSSDGKVALTSGHDPVIKMWELPGGRLMREFQGHTLVVRGVGFGRGGGTIFSAGADQTLRLWDTVTGTELNFAAQLPMGVVAVAVVPPGDAALVASDQSVSLWDISRAARYLEFGPRLDAARKSFAANPNDAPALATLGQWYALRGMNEWAVDLLEQAQAAGENPSPLLMARCYWKLGRLPEAAREFRRAIARPEAPADYLRMCLDAVTPGATTSPTAATTTTTASR